MNKYQRKRSKRIKKWMCILNAKGCNVTYRQTKRRMRRLDQTVNKWVSSWIHKFRYLGLPVCKEIVQRYAVNEPRKDGLNARIYIIDETPIVSEPAQWPKDNPFVRQYMGKWHYPTAALEESSRTNMNVE